MILGGLSLATLGTFLFKFLFERYVASIEERFKAHEARMNTVADTAETEREALRTHFDQLHEQTRTVWHKDIDRVNVEVGRMTERLTRAEKDVEGAMAEIKETAVESRRATEELRREIGNLRVAVTDLTATIRKSRDPGLTS